MAEFLQSQLADLKPLPSKTALQRPFGSESRNELLDHYFAGRTVGSSAAWKDVYKLLLWIDPTIGLAHCYESDKSQPGRAWYARSLAFHSWVAQRLGLEPRAVGEQIDWLFRRVLERYALSESGGGHRQAARAEEQRARYGGPMPDPFEDPELQVLLEEALGDAAPPEDELVALVRSIRLYVATENKRKNLLGEGFEDVLAAVLRRLDGGAPPIVETQKLIHEIEGFREQREGEKRAKVDLWLRSTTGRRTLVTAKWSVRADREKQLADDYRIYVDCNNSSDTFDYVFVTNEFDAARLVAACDRTEMNRQILDAVVHVSPEALMAAYGISPGDAKPKETGEKESAEERRAAARLPELMASGRLISLGDWLARVAA